MDNNQQERNPENAAAETLDFWKAYLQALQTIPHPHGLFMDPKKFGEMVAQIGNSYTQGAAAIQESIVKSNERMGEAFRKAGG